MIKLIATAPIQHITSVIEMQTRDGRLFQKRDLILDDSWERDGQVHPNPILIEFAGEKMSLLDAFAPGQRVQVEAFVNGREANGRVFTTLRGNSIVLFQAQRPLAAYPQQPPAAYPQQPQYAQQPQYSQGTYGAQGAPTVQGGNYPQPTAAYPQQAPQQAPQAYYPQEPQYPSANPAPAAPRNPGTADLPFNS